MTRQAFPVLSERGLKPVSRRFLRAPRRAVEELPGIEPGTMLVFDVNGRYEALDRRHLSGTEPHVLDAIAVSLVDMRPKVLAVDIQVPSASPADDFVIRANFHCVVSKPELVARDGLADATEPLRTYLKQDRTLLALGANFGVDQLAIMRDEATSRIGAYCEVRPPRVAGMEVTLATVEVFTPSDLRAQEKRMRDERWAQRYNTLKLGGERDFVDQTAELLANPEHAQSLAVARGEITAAEAATRAFAERADMRQNLQQLLEVLRETGHLDRVPVDAKPLVDSLTESITGRPASAGMPRQALDQGKAPVDDGPLYVVDEDDVAN